MKRHNLQWLAALACAALLSACGGANSSNTANAAADGAAAAPTAAENTPAAANTATAAPVVPGGSVTPRSACDIPGAWFFEGACTVENVTSPGAILALPSYRGVSIAMTFGANDAKGRVPFILGDAIGDRDISGMLNGKIAFAGYGETKCVTPGRSPVPCVGKALVYLLVVNAGNQTVTFKDTPTIALLRAGGYPGKKCGIATMVWTSPAGAAAWVVRSFSAEPNGEKLRFDPLTVAAKYASGSTFSVFAIVCRP